MFLPELENSRFVFIISTDDDDNDRGHNKTA